MFFNDPSTLLPNMADPQTLDRYFAFCHHELSQEETAQYISAAKSRGVTINDLLLSILFKTIGQWQQQSFTSINPSFRINVPLNLRKGQNDNIPVSNEVSIVFMDRCLEQCCGNVEELLQGIHREMNWIKRTEQKHYFLFLLKIRDYFGKGIYTYLHFRKCRYTVLFSNLGRVLEALPLPRREDGRLMVGDAVLESIDATPPIRLGSMISLLVLTYADRLRFFLRYDPLNLSIEEAKEFLQNLNQALLRL